MQLSVYRLLFFPLLALLLIAATAARNSLWKTEVLIWSDAESKSPRKIRIMINLGSSLFNDGKEEEGILYMKKALELDPASPEPYLNLGVYYTKKGDYNRALTYLLKPHSLQQTYLSYYRIGNLYALKGDTDLAIENYEKALELDPLYPFANLELGSMYMTKGAFTDALSAYNRAIKAAPREIMPYNNIGIIYIELADYDRAEEYLKRHLKIFPLYAPAWANLGNVYFYRGDMQKAEETYRKAIELDPQNAQIVANLSMALDALGKKEESEKTMKKALELNPELFK